MCNKSNKRAAFVQHLYTREFEVVKMALLLSRPNSTSFVECVNLCGNETLSSITECEDCISEHMERRENRKRFFVAIRRDFQN